MSVHDAVAWAMKQDLERGEGHELPLHPGLAASSVQAPSTPPTSATGGAARSSKTQVDSRGQLRAYSR